MAESFFRAFTRDDGETEIEVEIEVSTWGCSAQTFGPPESCFPAEPMECEVIGAWLVRDDDQPGEAVTLTDAERERIEREFEGDPPEPDYGPED